MPVVPATILEENNNTVAADVAAEPTADATSSSSGTKTTINYAEQKVSDDEQVFSYDDETCDEDEDGHVGGCSSKIIFPTSKLYGRDAEFNILESIFNNIYEASSSSSSKPSEQSAAALPSSNALTTNSPTNIGTDGAVDVDVDDSDIVPTDSHVNNNIINDSNETIKENGNPIPASIEDTVHVVMIGGYSGVGKSALVEAFVQQRLNGGGGLLDTTSTSSSSSKTSTSTSPKPSCIFLQGKYNEQYISADPLSGISQMMTQLANIALIEYETYLFSSSSSHSHRRQGSKEQDGNQSLTNIGLDESHKSTYSRTHDTTNAAGAVPGSKLRTIYGRLKAAGWMYSAEATILVRFFPGLYPLLLLQRSKRKRRKSASSMTSSQTSSGDITATSTRKSKGQLSDKKPSSFSSDNQTISSTTSSQRNSWRSKRNQSNKNKKETKNGGRRGGRRSSPTTTSSSSSNAGAGAGGNYDLSQLAYLLSSFLRCVSQPHCPLVLYLDDLQWADAASFELLEYLLCQSQTVVGSVNKDGVDAGDGPDANDGANATTVATGVSHLLMIASYRPNQIGYSYLFHQLETELENLKRLTKLELSTLSPQHIHSFLHDSLQHNMPVREVSTLTELIYSRTLGNIFFVKQALEELVRKHVVYLDRVVFEWRFTLTKDVDDGNGGGGGRITNSSHHAKRRGGSRGKNGKNNGEEGGGFEWKTVLSEDVVDMVKSKLQTLPHTVLSIVIVMSHVRSFLDLYTLHRLYYAVATAMAKEAGGLDDENGDVHEAAKSGASSGGRENQGGRRPQASPLTTSSRKAVPQSSSSSLGMTSHDSNEESKDFSLAEERHHYPVVETIQEMKKLLDYAVSAGILLETSFGVSADAGSATTPSMELSHHHDHDGMPLESSEHRGGAVPSIPANKTYKFSHDRIQEAAHGSLDHTVNAKISLTVHVATALANVALESGDDCSDNTSLSGISVSPMNHPEIEHDDDDDSHDDDHVIVQCTSIISNANEWMLFVAVEHLNSIDLHFVPDPIELSKWNFTVAELYLSKTLSEKAIALLRSAVLCLDFVAHSKNLWSDEEHYPFCLALYNQLAETELANGNFTEATVAIQTVLKNATHPNDMCHCYHTYISLVVQRNNQNKALGVIECIKLLNSVYFTKQQIPTNPTKGDVLMERMKFRLALRNRSLSVLADLPMAEDDRVMKLVSLLCRLATFSPGNGHMEQFVFLRGMRWSIDRGLSKYLPEIIVSYSIPLRKSGKYEESYACAAVVQRIYSERFPHLDYHRNKKMMDNKQNGSDGDGNVTISAGPNNDYALCMMILHSCIWHLKKPFRESLELMVDNYRLALAGGDTQVALSSAMHYPFYYYAEGLPLNGLLESRLEEFENKSRQLKQQGFIVIFRFCRQFLLNLQGKVKHPTKLKGTALDEDRCLSRLQGNSKKMTLRDLGIFRLILAFIFGDVDTMESMMDRLASYPLFDLPIVRQHLRLTFHGLAAFAVARKRPERASEFVKMGKSIQREVRKLESSGSVNAKPASLCLKAMEKHNKIAAFDEAIAACKKAQMVHLQAAMNEQCGKLLRDVPGGGEQTRHLSHQYLGRAMWLYYEWGALGKVKQMTKRYRYLLEWPREVVIESGSTDSNIRGATMSQVLEATNHHGTVADVFKHQKLHRVSDITKNNHPSSNGMSKQLSTSSKPMSTNSFDGNVFDEDDDANNDN